MSRKRELVKIHTLDTFHLGRPNIVAATALETGDGIALFDVGSEATFETLARQLTTIGQVRHVFLSHIHFDHAGAAWRFAELGATIYVHPQGAPHLIDPARLVESARRIFGDEMERLWGKVAPVPAERIRVLEDGDEVQLAPFTIRAVATPGHASHHHIYHWENAIFGGDVAGVRITSGPPIPPFVPPELHVESWHDSIRKLRALNVEHLYLPHFGKVTGNISDHLDALDERVTRWSEWLRDQIRSGLTETELRAVFAKYEHDDISAFANTPDASGLITDYETADPSHMAVSGALRYWKKFHPDQVI